MRNYIQFNMKSINGDEVQISVKENTDKIILTNLITDGLNDHAAKNESVYEDSIFIANANSIIHYLKDFYENCSSYKTVKFGCEFIYRFIDSMQPGLNKIQFYNQNNTTIQFEFGIEFKKPKDLNIIELKCASMKNSENPIFDIVNPEEKRKRCSYLSMQIQLI